jgi:hypothetical protein
MLKLYRAGFSLYSAVSSRLVSLSCMGAVLVSVASAVPRAVTFSQSADTVPAYDFVEVAIEVDGPDAPNPFTDVTISGEFGRTGQPQLVVDGFCDSGDGRIFRIRFMAAAAGDYTYSVALQQGDYRREHRGVFRAVDAHRRGILRVDPAYPFHLGVATLERRPIGGRVAGFAPAGCEKANIVRSRR